MPERSLLNPSNARRSDAPTDAPLAAASSSASTHVSPVLALRAAAAPGLVSLVAVASDGRIVDANASFLQLAGLEPTDLDLLRWDDLVAEASRAADAAARRGLWVDGSPRSWIQHCRRKDGSTVLVLIRAAPDPTRPGHWLAYIFDHTLAHDAGDALRESEERFRLLVEHVGDAVLMLDGDGRITTWTKAAQRLLGYDAEAALKLRVDDLYPEAERTAGKPRAELESALRDGRHETDALRIGRDGSTSWTHVVTCPIFGPRGELRGYAQILQDRTAMRRAERLVEQRTRELERSNQELERFASIAAYDLREPLRKLTTFGDRLRRMVGSSPAGADTGVVLDRMEASIARMHTLIDGLLTFARVARGSATTTDVNLNTIVSEVVSDLASNVATTGALVDVGPLPTLPGDALQMRQLFQNLLSNALKFKRPDTAPSIRISARSEGDEVQILVQDNGIGFDAKYRERIFEVLQRLHGRSAYEGAGLGLSICRRVVERHGGTITAHGALGEGATFSVRLPSSRTKVTQDGKTLA